MPSEETLEETRVLFAALSDRARMKILCARKNGGELCVCDVAHVLGTTISTVSHHLRKLRGLKLLRSLRDGNPPEREHVRSRRIHCAFLRP